MSDSDNDEEGSNVPATYGRGKAPGSAVNRFRPGRSGNYAGRPRRDRKKTKEIGPLDAILADANRLIELPNGEVRSMYEIALRAEGALGAKGNVHAVKNYLDRIQAAKAKQEEATRLLFEKVVLAKENLEQRLQRAVVRKEPLWGIHPHPDNIVVNYADRGAWVFGGLTPEETASRVVLLELFRLFKLGLAESESRLGRARKNAKERRYFEKCTTNVEHLSELCGHFIPVYLGPTPTYDLVAPSRPDTPRLREMHWQSMRMPGIEEIFATAGSMKILQDRDTWQIGRS